MEVPRAWTGAGPSCRSVSCSSGDVGVFGVQEKRFIVGKFGLRPTNVKGQMQRDISAANNEATNTEKGSLALIYNHT